MNAKRITISEGIDCVSKSDEFQICETVEGEKISCFVYGANEARKLALALLNWSIYEYEAK